MQCPFYGHDAIVSQGLLAATGGNQCALIVDAQTRCKLDADGLAPELDACDRNGSGRALLFATFTRAGQQRLFGAEAAPQAKYPD